MKNRIKKIIENEKSWTVLHEMRNTLSDMWFYSFIDTETFIELRKLCNDRMEVVKNAKGV